MPFNKPEMPIGLQPLSEVFIRFAERECKRSSPLYYQLSLEIAQEQEILALAAHCRKGQPIPNLFLGAVHFILLQHQDHALAAYYPSIDEKASDPVPMRD